MISPSQRLLSDNPQNSQQRNFHAPGGIRTHDCSGRAAEDLRLRPRGYWDRHFNSIIYVNSPELFQAPITEDTSCLFIRPHVPSVTSPHWIRCPRNYLKICKGIHLRSAYTVCSTSLRCQVRFTGVSNKRMNYGALMWWRCRTKGNNLRKTCLRVNSRSEIPSDIVWDIA